MSMPHAIVRKLGHLDTLDPLAEPIRDVVQRLVKPTPVRNLLSGTNLGHPLHPMLTDVPIGAWVLAAMFDVIGGRGTERAADALVATGIVAAVPTAASGFNDWSDTIDEDSRVGLIHASANTTALLLFGASLAARLRGRRGSGKVLTMLGVGVMTVGAYLGGHLSFVRGINVNRTAYEVRPREWTRAVEESALVEGQSLKVDVDGAPVVIFKLDGRIYALSAVCSHMGGPLEEGEIRDGCVICPWHGSTFRVTDGHIVRGPASTPQPHFETQVSEGWIEVRSNE